MEKINIRLYHGGQFVTTNHKTTYETRGGSVKAGVALYPNVDEVAYFEFVYWIKDELGYDDVGQIWFRKRGCSLYSGRKEIRSDIDIAEFLLSKEKDGWYHLYVTHEKNSNVGWGKNLNKLEGGTIGTTTMGDQSANIYNKAKENRSPQEKDSQSLTSAHPILHVSSQLKRGEKLPTFSTKKKKPVIEYQHEEEDDHSGPEMEDTVFLHEDELVNLDEDGALLSDEDYDDKGDDDIFAENVNYDIAELVKTSSGGGQYETSKDEYVDEETGGHGLDSDEDLNDSDDELFSVGLKFPSNKIFRKALVHHALSKGYDFYYLHNTSKRISVYCANRCHCKWSHARIHSCTCNRKKKCKFKIHCKKLKGEETFQIKSARFNHICRHQHVNPKCTSQYLAERYLEDFRDDPNMKVEPFMKRAKREVQCEIGYYKAYYAKVRALKMIFGDASTEYKRVWGYAQAIRTYYPGSTAVVNVDGNDNPSPLFQRLYICLQPCKEGLMAGCRPILGVDGAHLRGPYPGILLTADLDSVAASVKWVHEKDDDVVTYMSDRQKGLFDAFKVIVPNGEIRFCCRHIWTNFRNKFPGEVYREHFWKAARSSTKHHFLQHMEEIKKLNIDAYNYLQAIPVCNWSRHAFGSSSKSGMLLNNCCESFNNVLRESRSKPILSLMEWIRRYIMNRCNAKREGLKKFDGDIMPSVTKMIEKGLTLVSGLRIMQADLYEFEVDDEGDTYVVNLESRKCGCYRWSLMGIPCTHALGCIVKRRLEYEDFVHLAYHVTTYAATYSPTFRAMAGLAQWEKTPYPEPLPPPYRKMPGRPSKKKRVKEQGEDEERKSKLVKRGKKQNCCSKCGVVGHYMSKCQNMSLGPPTKMTGGRSIKPSTSAMKKPPMAKPRVATLNAIYSQASSSNNLAMSSQLTQE